MSDMKNYSGNPIDLSWQTAPWQRDGETIEKETENQEGTLTMTELPSEVNKDELSDMQEQILRTAVRNIGFSSSQIDEAVGCSEGYAADTLRTYTPEWYDNVFKTNGKSTDKTRNDRLEDEYDYPEPDNLETKEPEEIGQDEHISDMADEESIRYPQTDTTESPEWKGYAVVALVGFILGLLWGGRNE